MIKQKIASLAIAVAASAAIATTASAQTSANVFLDGGFFIQQGSVFNTSSTATLTSFMFALGTAGDGVATFDITGNAGAAGGVASDFLSDAIHFQTVTWAGLSVAPGGQFNFGAVDLDQIFQLSPLVIDPVTLTGGLQNAFLRAQFSDGTTLEGLLANQSWQIDQHITLGAVAGSVTPEPATMTLMATGLVGMMGAARRRRKAA